jgi:hypothetical protein
MIVENKKKSGVSTAIGGLIVMLTWFGFWQYCYLVAPRVPDEAKNRVYAENYHGTTIYLTLTEYVILWGIPVVALLIGLIFFLVKKYRRKS